jgi:hypothetical protein
MPIPDDRPNLPIFGGGPWLNGKFYIVKKLQTIGRSKFCPPWHTIVAYTIDNKR